MKHSTLSLQFAFDRPTANGKGIRNCYTISGSAEALQEIESFVANYEDLDYACPFQLLEDGTYRYWISQKAERATLTFNGDYYVFKPETKEETQCRKLTELMALHPTIPADILLKIIQGA